jgi:hypothetical protein
MKNSDTQWINRDLEGSSHFIPQHKILAFALKVKVKLSHCLIKQYDMKTKWGSRGVTPCVLN